MDEASFVKPLPRQTDMLAETPFGTFAALAAPCLLSTEQNVDSAEPHGKTHI